MVKREELNYAMQRAQQQNKSTGLKGETEFYTTTKCGSHIKIFISKIDIIDF